MEKKDRIVSIILILNLKGMGNKSVYSLISKNRIKLNKENTKKILLEKKNISEENFEQNWVSAEKIYNKSIEYGIEIIDYTDAKYPKKLREIDNFPLIIYAKGNTELLQKDALAVIGSRNHSKHAEKITTDYVKKFVKMGFVTVSGLANGIDTIAHESTLDYGGKTIAILPSNLKTIYPKDNYNLANRIIDNGGLLISEYSIDSKLNKFNFIQRNRLQSGISIGTFVVETSVKGGSIQTSKFTLKQSRYLFVYNPRERTDLNDGNFKLLENSLVIKIEDPTDFIPYLKHDLRENNLRKFF